MIKEQKLYTKSDRTSFHRWEANQFRLFLHSVANWLLHQLRRSTPRRSLWRWATFEALRRAFLKIAGRIEELKSRVRIALLSAHPYRKAMISMEGCIAAQGPRSTRRPPPHEAPTSTPNPALKLHFENRRQPGQPRPPRSNPPVVMNNSG